MNYESFHLIWAEIIGLLSKKIKKTYNKQYLDSIEKHKQAI